MVKKIFRNELTQEQLQGFNNEDEIEEYLELMNFLNEQANIGNDIFRDCIG